MFIVDYAGDAAQTLAVADACFAARFESGSFVNPQAARELLTLEEKDPRRLFEGNALLRRLIRLGVLDESQMKLDYVLGLRTEDFLERRLQTQVRDRSLSGLHRTQQ
jgi:hypothetical protein